MSQPGTKPLTCSLHGAPTHRSTCRECNAAYMRAYLRRRRAEAPAVSMWERARRRAGRLGLSFSLPRSAIVIPAACPALGIPIVTGKARSIHQR